MITLPVDRQIRSVFEASYDDMTENLSSMSCTSLGTSSLDSGELIVAIIANPIPSSRNSLRNVEQLCNSKLGLALFFSHSG